MTFKRFLVLTLIGLSLSLLALQPNSTVQAQGPVGLTGQPVGAQDKSYPIPAGAYFAAPNGTGETCSEAQPCSAATALKLVPSGKTVVFRGGTYFTGDIQFNKNVTLQPYLAEKPVFNGSQVVTDWTPDGDDWRTTWQHPHPKGGTDSAGDNSDMVWVNNDMLKPVKSRDAVEPGKFFYDYATNNVYIGTNPAGKTVEMARYWYGIERVYWNIGGVPGNADEAGFTLRGMKFMKYAQEGFWIRAAGAVVENSIFTNNAGRGMGAYRPIKSIRNSEFSKNRWAGGYFSGAGAIFENNIVRGNSFEGLNNSNGFSGIKFERADDALIRNNLFEDNQANGIWFDIGTERTTIVYNIVRNHRIPAEEGERDVNGIHIEISMDSVIAGNLLVGNDIGIGLTTAANVKIYNNTLVDNELNINVHEYFRDDPHALEGPGKTTNIDIKNNILSNGTITKFPWALLSVTSTFCDWQMVSALDHNAYYRSTASLPTNVIMWQHITNPGVEPCRKQYTNLASFKSEIKFEQHGLDLSGTTNPSFVNAAGGDYRLKAGSPAIGAGAALSAKVANALGWTAGVAVDLGALQTTPQNPGGNPTPTPTDDTPGEQPGENLLTNAGFETAHTTSNRLANGWKLKAGLSKRVCNKLNRPGKPDKIVAHAESCAFQLVSGGKLVQKFSPQTLGAGDTLTLSGFVRGKGVDGAKIVVKARYGDSTAEKLEVALPTGEYAYQAVNGTLALDKTVAKIKVQLIHSGTQGKIWLDALRLEIPATNGLVPLP